MQTRKLIMCLVSWQRRMGSPHPRF